MDLLAVAVPGWAIFPRVAAVSGRRRYVEKTGGAAIAAPPGLLDVIVVCRVLLE